MGATNQEAVLFDTQSPAEMDNESEWTHVTRPSSDTSIFEPLPISRPGAERNDTVANIFDDYLTDRADSANIASAYEETAFISGSLPSSKPSKTSVLAVDVPLDQLMDDVGIPADQVVHAAAYSIGLSDETINSDSHPEPSTIALKEQRDGPVFAHKASLPRDERQASHTALSEIAPTNDPKSEDPGHSTILEVESDAALSVGDHLSLQASIISPGSPPVSIKVEAEDELPSPSTPLSPLSPLDSISSPLTSVPISTPVPPPSAAILDQGQSRRKSSTTRSIHTDTERRPRRSEREKTREKVGHRKTRSHDRDGHGSEKEKERADRNRRKSREIQEQQWLEVVFDGLPFGPNGTTVSLLPVSTLAILVILGHGY